MVLALAAALVLAPTPQDIPEGVRYKKTTAALNQKATASLNKLFTAKTNPTIESAQVVICGPNLWKAIKPSAPAILTKAKDLIFMVPTDDQVKRLIGMRFRTADEQAAFWKLLHSKYATAKPGIRKATHDEIGYYWSIIPYDIEEPLLVVVSGKSRLMFDFTVEKGQPQAFTVELF
jgi:hypothetical protein